ncbi:protein kinase domain-containing protein [Streptomyces sp. NPDC003011]
MGTPGDDFRVIAGRYRLEARIGRGGMGVVWRATDELLGRQVAVKEIPLDLDETLPTRQALRQRDRTLREARAVAQLRHPHIIVVHDVVEHDERPYLVMELVDGGSLAERIAAHGPVDADEAARIGIALLGALRAAHAAGVLHRDIKPANVLVEDGTDRVVLTDFGIARVAGATTLTESGSFVGSPEYTAPERMSGARTGPASDLWSLGALLCTVLSGESPFHRDSLGGILHAVVSAEIRPPAQAAPILPVVRGLLERDPARRLDAARAERMLRTFRDTGRTPKPPPARTRSRTGPLRSRALPLGRARAEPSGPPPESPVDHPPKPPADRTPGPSSEYAPAWQDPSARPPADAAPGRSPRGVLVTLLLVAAMAGAGVSAAALLTNGGGHGFGTPTSPAPHTSASAGHSPSSTPTPTPTTTTTPNPTPTLGPTRSRSPDPTVPAGYRLADDPAGFALAVPDGFTRVRQGERVFYMSPEKTFRLGIRVAASGPGGPLTVLRRAAAEGPAAHPGYRDGRVVPTTHRGHRAASWEFTWNGFSAAEGPRHTYDLCWEEDGRLYDVWMSAPVGKAREARQYFVVAVDTLVTGL